MTIQAIRGFKDILPEETPWWRKAEATAARIMGNFGYQEIRIPLLEKTELFARSIGEDTDIVEKEMFTFPDRHDQPLTLRPEATAGIVRSMIEHKLTADGRPLKLWCIGPMFRYERPQKGRQRQFHQLDVEAFNVAAPQCDAEMIIVLDHFLKELGLDDVVMHINSLGCPDCRPIYKERLQAFLADKKTLLCPDCQRRIDANPLRVIDCKVPACREIVADAPSILDVICVDCRDHFAQVKDGLSETGISFEVNPRLVRGLDYYTRTTFEAQTGALGAQNAVAGGGRYDGLSKNLGGPDVPGIGFAVGLERLTMLMAERELLSLPGPDLFVATLDDASLKAVFALTQELRKKGLNVETDYSSGSLKSRMKRADKLGAGAVLIVGPEELSRGEAILRNMATKEQTTVSLAGATERIAMLIKGEEH